ncbi:hypothetical protein THRCLA_03483 [Thraustotheca clavata]|uniref:Acyltransferase n=1 Tax=Thraustotheca clavata TaxID=74557 RepID=A0A1W0A1Y0_9STRA|nr:hypothetical protein THRCLA_03483 [Thraustotheca clavata]
MSSHRIEYAESHLFKATYKFLFPLYTKFYDWTIEGGENIPKDGRILYVGYHSIHNHDIFPIGASIYKATGELPRGLVHRLVMLVLGPLLYPLGCIEGSQKEAIQAYDEGCNCVCMPGGGEEAMQGFESAYKLIWKSNSGKQRTGFAALARKVNAIIVPFVTRNGEEMFFNIFAYLWNIVGLSRLYERLLHLPQPFKWLSTQIKMYVWFLVWTFLSIPVPVRAGIVFGKPIIPGKDESEVDLAQRTKNQLQKLIDRVNPGHKVHYEDDFFFQLAYKFIFPYFIYFYNWSIENQDIIPKTGRILYVGYHSIHAHDLFPIGASIYKATGELPRGLFHHTFMFLVGMMISPNHLLSFNIGPFFRHWGCIAGTPKEAIKAYNEGYNCCCMPGGGEEAMRGFESAYKVIWKSNSGRQREGFAELAIEVDATIVPFVTRNGEEMVFSIIGFLWNIVGLSRLYERLLNIPSFRWIGAQIKMNIPYLIWAFLSIPIPVQAGIVFGKPIVPIEGESADKLAERTRTQMQELVNRVNSGGHSYSRGLKDRFQS